MQKEKFQKSHSNLCGGGFLVGKISVLSLFMSRKVLGYESCLIISEKTRLFYQH